MTTLSLPSIRAQIDAEFTPERATAWAQTEHGKDALADLYADIARPAEIVRDNQNIYDPESK
ncbi:MAG: hypothetical protein ACTS5I_09125 [Rhodanobacter sp.]